jgi:HEAT repeat protein
MESVDADVDYLERENDVKGLIQALKHQDYLVRKEAARALKGVGDERAVEALIGSLEYQSWQDDYVILRSVRENSAEALGSIGDERAINPLILAMREDPNEEVRWKAASALGKIGDSKAVKPLIEAIYDYDWNVRTQAANALGIIGDLHAVPNLMEALEDSEWHVRKYAAMALGKMKDKRAIPILVEALEDEDADVRWKSMLALEKFGDSAVNPLIDALKSKNWRLRARAVEVLGRIGSEEAFNGLMAIISDNMDSNRHVRGKAAEAMGRIGDRRALGVLDNLRNDEYSYVQDKAEIAVSQILKSRKYLQIMNYNDGEITFNFSDNWEIITIPNKKKVVKGQFANSSITLSVNRNIEVTDISLKEFEHMLKDVFTIQNNQLLEEIEFERDEMEGYQLVGENKNIIPTRILIVSFKRDDLLYYLWFAGDPAAFHEAKEDLSLIIDSFYIYPNN